MSFNQYYLAREIADYIKAERPGASVGVTQLDTADAPLPQVLVFPIGLAAHDGSMDKNDMAECRIQVTCIGKTQEQAAGMQSGVYRMLLAQTGSEFNAVLTAGGQAPLWRFGESQGAIVAGDQIYRTDDTYVFKEKIL